MSKERKNEDMAGYGYEFEDLTPGTILECTWGWSMTIVDFYRVVGRWGKAHVSLEKLEKKVVDGDGMVGRCVPDCGKVIDHITNVFYSKKYKALKLDKNRILSIWNGRPCYHNYFD